MEYDAVTIDSNIFIEYGVNLEGGVLAQLYQFREGSAEFVLSEIVVREIKRYLIDEAQKAKDSLASAIRKSGKSALLHPKMVEQMNGINATAFTPQTAADKRLDDFIMLSGCDVIAADEGDMKRLIAMYFEPSAPFEGSGKKKNEFPDAIALITLEDWAKEHKKKILAISKDDGWTNFAAKSEFIDIEKELPVALERLQKHAELAKAIVAKVIKAVDQIEDKELRTNFEETIKGTLMVSPPRIEAQASYPYDVENEYFDLRDIHFHELVGGAGYEFYVLNISRNKIVAQVYVNIDFVVEADFNFQIYDAVDGDYVTVSSDGQNAEVNLDAAFLIEIEGDFSSETPDYRVSSIELVDVPKSIDFGSVDINRSDDGR
jgi:hypothetical protein